MSRRRKQDGIFENLLDLFMVIPTWVCLPMAAVVCFGVKLGLPMLAVNDPFLKALAQNSEMFGRYMGMTVIVIGLIAALKKFQRRQLYDQQRDINSIRDLNWSDFELLIGEAYRRQGYQVTENGGGGADGGIDLILHRQQQKILVQCKQWKAWNVGVKPIRELYGVLMAEGADRAIFVTSGVYTQDARNFASGKRLELIDGNTLSKMITPIRDQQNVTIKTTATPSTSPATTPACPICRSPMILKTARRGRNPGSQFWGCSTYGTTKCRGILQVGQQ